MHHIEDKNNFPVKNARTLNTSNNAALLPVPSKKTRTSKIQGDLLQILKEVEIDGVGMGVLSDGTPFLSGRGLARLCGVDSSRISEISNDWSNSKGVSTIKIINILQHRGFSIPQKPYIEIQSKTSNFFYAYPDNICLAILEYYAFDASQTKEQALQNYRILAGKSLHDFIYAQVGYRIEENLPEAWQQFHARVSLTYNSIPPGYFGIFKEIADMIVTLGEAGLHIDSSFVPDISVGKTWSSYWNENNLNSKYGEPKKWEHNYPDMFPQSRSNPQYPACYPESALGEFRKWFREIYIGGGKFSKYINDQIKKKALPPSFAQLVTKAYALDE